MFKNKPLAALVALACSPLALAATSVTQLDEVVVTASRSPDKVSDLPVNVSIITAADIANSTARTVEDLLSTLAGVHVFNNTGSADSAMVDLRGFGMTGLSNTLILIDGVKQNTNDLSAPNLGVVPLSEIERIEVVRGSGAVAYGGGTTGGVVNIITRSGFKAANGVQATLTAGSYNLKKLDLSGHLSGQQVALDGYIKSMTTDNYRANNAERNDSAGLTATVRHQGGDVRLYARSSNQDLRLPGARTVNPATGVDEFGNDPRGTSKPNDYMDIKTDAFGVQARQSLGEGMLSLDVATRAKQSQSESSGWLEQRDLDEQSASLRYEQELGRHRLVFGVDTLQSDMDVNNGSPATLSTRIRQRHVGGFADVLLRPQAGTSISIGGRTQRIEDSAVDFTGFANSYRTNKELHAWQLGARQALSGQLEVYAKVGRSFRLANADEQAYVSSPLLPQTSQDKEIGLDWKQGGQALRAAWFRYDLTNEIHFNKLVGFFGSNVNLEPTRRQGLELEGRSQLAANLELNGNLTWQQATFRQGRAGGVELAGNEVPMVPRQLATLGLSWLPQEASRIGLQLQYVGKQRLDNDQANQFDKQLDAYTVLNAKFSHRYSKQLSVALDVNNLFDRHYATYGIRSGATGSSGSYNLYPAAGRNVQASLTLNY
ncbi:TonB-dependent receptor [Vogesella alkaliphila]|uniref:TonB-dependent receptor n=1 Tax=Vogesella alkaliphila TaxID=1193621 RepID=A0ABQ2YY59_9NEIS|nr:TonB-dependent receptor [Vogesella alkaliphila]GGX99238.1 TonB-dependent receptor [Vogesella alkaliphila]